MFVLEGPRRDGIGTYVEARASGWLPDLDLERLAGFVDAESQTQAMRELVAWMRARE